MIGAYHSHPASAAGAIATDIAEANSGPDFVYVIVSLVNDEVRAYRYQEGAVVFLPLTLSSEP